nr:MAG TPA: Putative antitoxin of bacterial toxin-antitoxin system, YdaS/YdaT [Caudoviricetes sp.]
MLAAGKRTGSIEKCILIEELTNGEVTVEDLRPNNSWDKMKNNLLRRMLKE